MNIIIPSSLRRHTDGRSTVKVNATNIDGALSELIDQFPELRGQLYEEDGQLVSFVNVFVNGDNIRDLDQSATLLCDRDEMLIVPALAGG